MPANPKYLEKSPLQKLAKLSAGVFGGYIISSLFHMVLALIVPFPKEFIATSIVTIYVLWVALLILSYFFRNGWKVWGVYIIISIVLYGFYYFANQQNPFV